jgi:dTDP-4-amino-4,6-dideoxygalactose transaminase
VPAFTYPATSNVVELVGARTALLDVDPETYCTTAAHLRAALEAWSGPETPRAMIPVHEFGAPCGGDELLEVAGAGGLLVVEDAACALGTRVGERHAGTLGTAGCFSWHPRKGITTAEGGCIVTADEELARRARSLRAHGFENADLVRPGFNYRMSELSAALGSAQLARFPGWLEERHALVRRYLERLAGVPGLRLPGELPGHAWQTFMVVVPEGTDRDGLIATLRERGVETNLGAQAIHCLAHYRERYGWDRDAFPVAAELYERGLALPLFAGLRPDEVDRVAELLAEVLAG